MERSRVLLIGDAPSFVLTVGRLLRDHGYDVTVKAWNDDLSDVSVCPPHILVIDGPAMTALGASVIGWLVDDPMVRHIPVVVCADQITLLPYAVRALRRRPGLVLASCWERAEFLAKLSALESIDILQEQAR